LYKAAYTQKSGSKRLAKEKNERNKGFFEIKSGKIRNRRSVRRGDSNRGIFYSAGRKAIPVSRAVSVSLRDSASIRRARAAVSVCRHNAGANSSVRAAGNINTISNSSGNTNTNAKAVCCA
jgi:hypothetical protein